MLAWGKHMSQLDVGAKIPEILVNGRPWEPWSAIEPRPAAWSFRSRLATTLRSILLAITVCSLAAAALAQDEYNPFFDVEISEDIFALPEAVQVTRTQLIDATRSGDIETLRAVIEEQGGAPTVSFGLPDDPVSYLREQSLDPDGRQILALLRNLLELPYAIYGASSDSPSYVWPYLAVIDLDELTPDQEVDVYRLVDPDQLEGMREFGGWYYWRVYIGADGEWQAFVAGD